MATIKGISCLKNEAFYQDCVVLSVSIVLSVLIDSRLETKTTRQSSHFFQMLVVVSDIFFQPCPPVKPVKRVDHM